MENNKYQNNAVVFSEKITSAIKTIFKVYGNELLLKFEDINLLSDPKNCIETSTAIGFIFEEFIFRKLNYFFNKDRDSIFFSRDDTGTTQSSYDFFSIYENEKFLINVKADKGNNNAVAAINKLHSDYTKYEDYPKHYLILKIKYVCNYDNNHIERKIIIKDIFCFYLEEVNFKNGHSQDHRNWSSVYNKNSGRLQISKNFLTNNRLKKEEWSYDETKKMIINIYNS